MQQSSIEGGAGLPNAWKPRVLRARARRKDCRCVHRDAEFLNLRNYRVNDIARIFGVPPHMMQDLDRATLIISNIASNS